MGPFVVIGGIGGSGTRMVITILKELGLNIGNDLNEANDNLTYTFLFKHLYPVDLKQNMNIMKKEMGILKSPLSEKELEIIQFLSKSGRPGHPWSWIQDRANHIKASIGKYSIQKHSLKLKPLINKWGWKEPNSHRMMKSMQELYPKTKFIMVVRNGLDMAYSNNQNQLRLWGPEILPDEYKKYDKQHHIIYTPKSSLKYWRIVHENIINELKHNFLMISFDDMCKNPEKWLKILFKFLEIDDSLIPNVIHLIDPPKNSIGKYKNYKHDFDKSDLEFNSKLGFTEH